MDWGRAVTTFRECPVPVRVDPQWGRAAVRLDMPLSDYAEHRERGERWCSYHRHWHPATTPFTSNTSICQRSWQSYKQALRERRAS